MVADVGGRATTAELTSTRALRRPADVRRWLASEPSADELAAAFPDAWRSVEAELGLMLASGDQADVTAYIARLAQPVAGARRGAGRSQEQVALDGHVRQHLAATILRQVHLQTATGVTDGRIRFNLFNGSIAQRLLFADDLVRKPVSLRWFRLLWPLVWQKQLLMPLVERKGIYCFYSAPLIHKLAALIGDRPCLEIAAGDGTLSRFLTDAGVEVTATDDHSWSSSVDYPSSVLRRDAASALRRFQPQVVVCSWPPAGNRFEREVFRTASVELYIVIGSSAESNSGNWTDYRSQSHFDMAEDVELSPLVLPPELGTKVVVFTRQAH